MLPLRHQQNQRFRPVTCWGPVQFSSIPRPLRERGFFCQTAHLVAVKNPAVILKRQAFETHFNRLCSESEQWWNLF